MQQTKKTLQQHCNKCTNKCNNSKEQTPYVWQSVPTSLNVHVIQVPRDICRLECQFRRYSGSVGAVWCLSATRNWSGTSDAILLHLSFQNVSFDGKAGCWTIAIDQEERWNLLINFYVWPLALIYICASCISLFVPIAFYICANLSQSFLHFFKPQSVPTFQKCHNIADTCGKGNFQLLEP